MNQEHTVAASGGRRREVDVCIIGGGLSATMQARHLRMYVPDVSVAIIEARTDEEMKSSRKVGESTVEVAGIFMARDLDLYDYLVENQLPKYGLNFHFRDPDTPNERLTDYVSYMAHIFGPFPSWQLDRRVLERDLLNMSEEIGVEVMRPVRAKSMERRHGRYFIDAVETGPDGERTPLTVEARWVIDGSGRKHFVSNQVLKGNIVKEERPNTGAFWIRIKDPDRRVFSETVRDARTMTSPYYATNHFFGLGHWIWMIPLVSGELSVGIVCDKDVLPVEEIFSDDKFLAFLEREHPLVHNVCRSGEIVDRLALAHLPFRAQQFYSTDRWALIGDSASFLDPLYSLGISMTCFQICQVSRLIEMDLVEDVAPERLELVTGKYDGYFSDLFDNTLLIYKNMYHISDDPRAMQEKIRFEQVIWFQMTVPFFVTRHFLQTRYIRRAGTQRSDSFENLLTRHEELYAALRESDYHPDFIETMYDDSVLRSPLQDCIFEFENSNVFPEVAGVYLTSIRMRVRLLFGIYGLGALGKWKHWRNIGRDLVTSVLIRFYGFRRNLRLKKEKRPTNNLLKEQQRRYRAWPPSRPAEG